MSLHFKTLVAFCDNYPPIQRAYRDFLYAEPTMDPESFKRITTKLCHISETIVFLIKCLSFHMALAVGKKTMNNRLFVEYLEGASGNIKKAREYIDLAARELQLFQEAEEEQDESSKFSYRLQFTLLTQSSD